MRISDWSSDVCSSDLVDEESCPGAQAAYRPVIGDGQDIVSHGRHPSVVNSGPTFSHQGHRSRKAGPYLPVISRSTSLQVLRLQLCGWHLPSLPKISTFHSHLPWSPGCLSRIPVHLTPAHSHSPL